MWTLIKRLNYIDWAKAIGIALICIGHFLPPGAYIKGIIYSFHVPMFAFVSGLLIKTPQSISDCFKRVLGILKKVALPYTVWYIISCLTYEGIREVKPSRLLALYTFSNGKTIWNEALWYAPVFIVAAVAFTFLFWVIRGNTVITLCMSAAGLVGFIIIDKLGIPTSLFGLNNFFGAKNLILIFSFIALGASLKKGIGFLAEFRETPLKNPFLYLFAGVFLACALRTGAINNGNVISLLYGDYNDPIRFVFYAIAMSVSFIVVCTALPRSKKAELMSKNSMFIMCSHYLFLKYVFWANYEYHLRTVFAGFTAALTLLLIYILVCMLADLLQSRYNWTSKPLAFIGISP